MKAYLTGAVAAAGLTLALPLSAGAATFVSQLEYRDGLVGAQSPSFGTVTLEETDAHTVKVTVALANAASLFVNTGGPHDPFLFNTQHDDVVTILPPVGTFSDAGHGSFQATPFGTFSDKIACCTYSADVYETDVYPADVLGDYHATQVVYNPAHGRNPPTIKYNVGDVIHNPNDFHYGAQEVLHHAGDPVVGHQHIVHHQGDELNGAANGQAGPLVFTVANAAGITFAGVGYSFDADGKVTGLGTGEHFVSNDGGWWFSADIFDGKTGLTYNVSARDAFGPSRPFGVPEPATWGLLIVGFGGVGAILRRSRRLARAALA